MKIGDILIDSYAALAPMAGVADAAFRSVCRRFGAGYTVSEMASARALVFQPDKTGELLLPESGERPFAVQIFGSEPEIMARGAQLALGISRAQVLDINMGCPTPKIVNNGDGSALMRDPARAAAVIAAVVRAVDVPVTVKFRLGWDAGSRNAVEFARMAEACGAAAVCVHGRTREQMYAGRADWDALACVREAVNIPFIANGDVFSAEDAQALYARTGCDLVMVGRGALGNPWIFAQIEAQMRGLARPSAPELPERFTVAQEQIALAAARKGERVAVLEARKHLAWYLKGVRGSAAYRARFSAVTSLMEMDELIQEFMERRPDLEI